MRGPKPYGEGTAFLHTVARGPVPRDRPIEGDTPADKPRPTIPTPAKKLTRTATAATAIAAATAPAVHTFRLFGLAFLSQRVELHQLFF